MTEKEELEQIAFDEGVPVDYVHFRSERLAGLYVDGSVALKSGMTNTKTADTLAEELGHHYTTVGNILNQTNTAARKQERAARMWAYDKRIGLSGIIQGFRQHCRSRYELAECLGVTEEFLQEAIECYKAKYGHIVELDGYIILFEPTLAVMEKF